MKSLKTAKTPKKPQKTPKSGSTKTVKGPSIYEKGPPIPYFSKKRRTPKAEVEVKPKKPKKPTLADLGVEFLRPRTRYWNKEGRPLSTTEELLVSYMEDRYLVHLVDEGPPPKDAPRNVKDAYRRRVKRDREAFRASLLRRTPLQVAAPMRVPDVSRAKFTPFKVYEATPYYNDAFLKANHPDIYEVRDDEGKLVKILLNRPCPWLPNPESNSHATRMFRWLIINERDKVIDGMLIPTTLVERDDEIALEAQILITRKDELSPQETMRLLEFQEATQGIDTAPVHRSLRDQAPDLPTSKTLLAYEYARGALSHVSRDDLHTLLADAPRRQD